MSEDELPQIWIGKDGKRMILIPAGGFGAASATRS
jgi:hypothetical protein